MICPFSRPHSSSTALSYASTSEKEEQHPFSLFGQAELAEWFERNQIPVEPDDISLTNEILENIQHFLHMCGKPVTISLTLEICKAHSMVRA